jgi:hypothetical protein
VNRWVERHRGTLVAEFDVGEQLLAAHRVEVRGSAKNAMDDDRVRTRGSRRVRWTAASENGFVVPGPIFVLGVSDRRLVVWRASPWMARPVAMEHSIPIEDVVRIVALRRLGRTNVAVLLESGALLMVQSLWGRGLRDLERAFNQARDDRRA